jgi:hypothetical protein
VDRFDSFLRRTFHSWVRIAEPPRGTRRAILRRAALARKDLTNRGYLPAHLQAWNLPGRRSGISDLWKLRFGAILAPYHSGSLKQVM